MDRYYSNNRGGNAILNVAEKPSVAKEVTAILSNHNHQREVK
jgi:hypothetical protein